MIDLIDKKHFISFFDFVRVDHFIYFSNETFNALVQIDTDTKKVVHMEPFIGEALNKAHIHNGCILYKNQIFFYSTSTSRINIYDLEKREQYIIDTEGIQGGFVAADICEEELNFLPLYLENGICRYDSDSHSLQKVSWYQDLMQGRYWYSNMMQNVWIAYEWQGNRCVIMDLVRKEVRKFFTKHKIYRLNYSDGNIWYVSTKKGSVYLYSLESDTECEYAFENWKDTNVTGAQYASVFATDKYIFLIFGDTGQLYVMDQENKQRRELITFTEDTIDQFAPFGYDVSKMQMEDTLFLFFQQRNVVAQIDLITLAVEIIPLDFSEDQEVIEYLSRYNYEYSVIMPDDTVSLNRFIDLCIGKTENE